MQFAVIPYPVHPDMGRHLYLNQVVSTLPFDLQLFCADKTIKVERYVSTTMQSLGLITDEIDVTIRRQAVT